ncbi:hypothetical protein PENSTE_c007G09736 [Penicillium steckii]|uniref:Uncharacterized protein n=1 Tax=Penicillium steckii TaxID=303698 RepID=A0A1V6TDY9_9EURO|nr:hypothetical protein PENSTE_c007G09736 [Penicillium steckii]
MPYADGIWSTAEMWSRYADSGIAHPLICPVFPLPGEGPQLNS